ncbi:MAG: Glu/Leu/Phe/Val dehydrogenase [Candidatus Adiutrix sp.]|jgi:glutamate dehydrogenase/leucine dehydrogenase|nr:Glu/Leu/Phe/Val dehydrogenase [Candidatus Adiutrix sp.]
MKNVWEEAQFNLRTAAETMGLEPEITERLLTPMRFTEFTIPVRMDDGRKKIFTAYRSWHQDATGPTKDGTRVRPNLTPEEIKALSLFMSIKHAVAGIPAGGGKGGIKADPAALSEGEYERLIRGFMRRLAPKGAFVDIPGADIGTGAQAMAWMLDEYEQMNGFHSPAAVNDKPFELGGSRGGFEATGWGVAACAERAAGELKLAGGRVVIQGFGQVGSITAGALFQSGYKIVAVSDISGAVAAQKGLNIPALVEHVEKTGQVAGFGEASAAPAAALLETDCDILIPAAVQDVITEENAGRVKAGLIVEAANAPTTPAADAVLLKLGRTIVPDVVANSGGAIVCDFERSQGLSNDYWSLEKVREKLRGRILTAYDEARAQAAERGVSMRQGAWINALSKIRAAMMWRGWC